MMKITDFLNDFINLIFPKTCFSCNYRIVEDIICTNCRNELIRQKDFCAYCGSSLKNGKCFICQNENILFDQICSVFEFDNVLQKLIHHFKYDEKKKIAAFFAECAINYIEFNNLFKKIDCIVPVPLHSVKKRLRGFNQSELIARKIAQHFDWNLCSSIIHRNRFTKTQTNLSKKERKQNVAGAFSLKKGTNLNGKTIIVVDDVFTTGSTINALADLLKNNGAEKIYAFTIARA